jgi:hypothetical protein
MRDGVSVKKSSDICELVTSFHRRQGFLGGMLVRPGDVWVGEQCL